MRLLPPADDRARYVVFLLLFLAPLLFGGLALLLGQDANWDLRNYHWYNAYAFLNGRYGFDLLPSQIPYFYNPLLDIPFYLLATHVPAKVAGFVLGAVQGLNFVLLFLISFSALEIETSYRKILISAFLAALGMFGGEGLSLIGTTFGDNLTSLGVLLAVLLIIHNHKRLLLDRPQKAYALIFGFGILPGLMMGLKLPEVIFCVGTCFALLFAGGAWQRRFMLSLFFGFGILLGVALSLGHWAWALQVHFGNPLFPYFNDTFKSPMLGNINLRDTKFLPHNVFEAISFPFLFAENPLRVGEIPWRDWRIPILYIVLPLSIFMRFALPIQSREILTRSYATRYLLWMGGISYVAWLGMFAIYRYIVPIEMLAPLLILCALALWPVSNRTRLVVTTLLLFVIASSITPGNWTRRTSWSDHFVETGIPSLGNTSNLMILMAGIEPYAHLIPQFPPEIPFVRIQSNFSDPGQANGMNQLIHNRVDAHKGRFMILIPQWNEKDAERAMGYFGLHFAPQPCQKVEDRLYDVSPMELCSVIHTNQG